MLEVDGRDNETLNEGCNEACATEPASCEPPRLKVLLIEDDAVDSTLIERCLDHMAKYERQLTVAGTLAAALFAVSADDFDIILLSDGMRDTPAAALLAALGDPLERCPTVLLTSYRSPATEGQALSLGAAACLAKLGLSPKLLEACIEQALRQHAQHCTRMSLAAASHETMVLSG